MSTANGHGAGYSLNGNGNGKCTPPPAFTAADRFEWERIVRRIVVPKHVKLLALVIATYADANGTRVRPGVPRLAAITGDDERNVRRILHVLRDELGLLELVSRGGGRGRGKKTTVYRLAIPVDLLERATLLDPEEKTTDSADIWVSGESAHPADTQMSGQWPESPVDNPRSSGHLGVRWLAPAAVD